MSEDKSQSLKQKLCYVIIYLILFFFHSCVFPRSIPIGILLTVIFILYVSTFRQSKLAWIQAIFSLMLIAGLIIPPHEYDKIILRPLRNLKKVGPLEFNQIDKFSSGNKLDISNFNLKKNYINNGSFEIMMDSTQSRWGTGRYSNEIRLYNPEEPVYFIKFGGVRASADITPEESIGGEQSLHIKQSSSAVENSVGLLEQEIYLEPGEYVLSLKAKVGYIVGNAIWIRLFDQNWFGETGFDIPGDDKDIMKSLPNWNLYQYRFKIDKEGVFYRPCKEKNVSSENCSYVKTEYKLKAGTDFRLIESGYRSKEPTFKTTFSIIVRDLCEVWIDDVRLEKK
ncbi:MAG: hypothetical protein ABH865_03905 [Candidatus Omnitrophota bacterium]